MAFPSPPPAPQRGDRTTFSNRVDAFLTWLTNLVPQMNAFLSSLTTLAGGGANAFAYTFDTATTDSDPGNGKVRFGSATQNTTNVIRIDTLAANGGDVTAFMTALQAGTSNVKASLRLQKVSDPATYLLFDITAVTAATGYLNLTVTPRVSTAASPFAANDTLILFFDPKGDKGDGGGTPTAQQIRDAIGTLGIPNGGTGATTAAAALANLGGASTAGATFTGPITLNNGTPIQLKDSTGTPRAFAFIGGDNQVSIVNGGGTLTRILNQAMSVVLWAINDSGATSQNGSSTINSTASNATALTLANTTSGNLLTMQGTGSAPNKTLRITGSTLELFDNAYANRLLAISDAGDMVLRGNFSANTVTETSDERKKTNWRALTDAQLDALAELEKVGVFDWLDGSGAAVGASAQQIRAIVPEVVREDAEGNLSVGYGGLAFAMAHGALRRSKAAA